MSIDENYSRRQFMSGAALTTAGVATGLSYFFSKDAIPNPNRPGVRVGFIGVGSRGGALLRAMLKVPGSEVVGICDARDVAVDAGASNVIANAAAGNRSAPEVLRTDDFRKIIAPDNGIEAVVIATPHFLHGPMAIEALENGKHVYCEKAMAFTVGECRDLHRLATERAPGQVFQVGHQRHYSKMYRKVKEMVDGGRIGNVTAARAQWNRNDEIRRPCEDPALEKVINWRLYSEYSGGLMSEFASHQIDVINMLLDTHPHSICAMGGRDYPRYDDGRDTSDNVHCVFTYMADWREFKQGPDGQWEFARTGKLYPVRFSYMSIMTNSLDGPSELILGDEGSIEVSLAGGDFWKEAKVLRRPDKIAQGTNPAQTHQKEILKSGATIAAVTKGRPQPDLEIAIPKDRADWSEYVHLTGEHSPQETLLALESFLECIRAARDKRDYKVAADATIGLWGAAPTIMANIAMRENRTVYWEEFFPA